MGVAHTRALDPRTFTPTALLAGLAMIAWLPYTVQAAGPALPEAVTTVNATCASALRTDAHAIGPLPVGLSAECDESGSSQQGRFGEASWLATGSANTGLGSQTGTVGLANADSHVSATNINGRASVLGSALTTFYWRLTLDPGAPFMPSTVPVRFSAFGEGNISGSGYEYGGQVKAETGLQWPGFPLTQFSFDSGERYNFGSIDRQFSGSTVLAIAPGYAIAGWVQASCRVSAVGFAIDGQTPQPLTSEATCTVSADPMLSLDQSAFDSIYGPEAFQLADYARLEYSSNVPVPEPATALLLVMGLSSVGLVRWLQRRGAAQG